MSGNENYDDRRVPDERTDYDDDRAWESADADEVARATAAGDDEIVYADGREGDDGWLGEGLGVALVLTGILLFVIPEPASSVTGLGLIVIGLVVWIAAEMW